MTKLNNEQMNKVQGAGFWGGFTCGVAIVAAVVEPTPFGELLAIGTCGWALEG
jgi:hypothetical protein